MRSEKLSISLPSPLIKFIEAYKDHHERKSKSSVVEEAVTLLRERELEQAYAEASQEGDPAWDVTVADGLTDETW